MADSLTDRQHYIVARWEQAYEEWERGESHSPSMTDLVGYAHEIDPNVPDPYSDEGYALGDRLYEAFCDSATLEQLVELLP